MLKFAFSFAILGTLSSTAYCIIALVAAVHFKRGTRSSSVSTDSRDSIPKSVSVLKPLHGGDPDLEQNLITFYEQDHSNFEILFGARTLDDPGLRIARRLSERYPDVPTRIVASGEPEWPNARAYSVSSLVPEAQHATLVISDSDVRVNKTFLTTIIHPLGDPGVGLVTCLYRGVSLGGVWSRLEALGMSVELMSNVLTANMLSGMDFALGPATATQRQHLDSIGGLREVGAYYADDFALGQRVSQSGLKVVLSEAIVEHMVPTASFSQSFLHQTLWMKNNRYLRPRGHLGLGLTFAMPYAILGALLCAVAGAPLTGFAWGCYGVLLCIFRCIGVGWVVVRDQAALTHAVIYPVRDLLGFLIWLFTWFGNTVVFRGERYTLLQNGRVERVSEAK